VKSKPDEFKSTAIFSGESIILPKKSRT